MGNVYKWYLKRDDITTHVSSDPIGYTLDDATDGDQIWCELTTNCDCRSGSTAISKIINISGSTLIKSISITCDPISPICNGTYVTFTAHPVNYSTPNYQWKLNGNNVGTNSQFYTSSSLSNNDSITCVCTEDGGGDPNTSNTIIMIVNSVTPSVSIEFGVWRNNVWTLQSNPICQGDHVQFRTNQITNGGNNPYFIWWKGSNVVSYGFNQTWYDDWSLNDNDEIYVVMTSYAQCANPTNVDSNLITMDVNPILTSTVSITPTTNTCCYGYNVTFTATPTNGGSSPIYNWYVNNNLNQTGSNVIYIYIPVNGDIVHCEMISNLSCVNNLAISNYVQNNILPNITPTISIDVNMELPFCETNLPYLTFYAIINGGNISYPHYQWQRDNGSGYINVGYDQNYYWPSEDGIIQTDDKIKVILSTSEQCVTSPVTSNVFTVTVQQAVTPSLYIVRTPYGQISCGTLVTFTAYPGDGGLSPTYIWRKLSNGVSTIVGTGNIYSTTTLNNGDIISCMMTSSLSCVTTPFATNEIYIYFIVYNPTPSLSIYLTVNPVSPPNGTTIMSVSTQYPIISENTINDLYKWYQLDSNGDPTILLETTPYNIQHHGPFSPNPWSTQRYQCKFISYHTCFSSTLPFEVWSNVVTLYTIFQTPFQINVKPLIGNTGCGLFLTLPNDGVTNNYLVGPPPGNSGSLIVFPFANNSADGKIQQNKISLFYPGLYLCYFYSESHEPGLYAYNIEIKNEFDIQIENWNTATVGGPTANLYKWYEAFYISVDNNGNHYIDKLYDTPQGILRKSAPPYGKPYVWEDNNIFYCFDLSVGDITSWHWSFKITNSVYYAHFQEYINGSWTELWPYKFYTTTQNPIIKFVDYSNTQLRAELTPNNLGESNTGKYTFIS